jgi:hypothetical protein
MVYQEHIKKMTFFLTKIFMLPELDSVVKRLWFAYLDRWRESNYPLLSKFTFSYAGHFETGITSKKHPGTVHLQIPKKTLTELEEKDKDANMFKQTRKKSLNYDFIFGDMGNTSMKPKKSVDMSDLRDSKVVFLGEDEMKRAQDFFRKSKRMYKSERLISKKKALNSQKVRRRSSLLKEFLPASKDKEIEKLRAVDDLEVGIILLGKFEKEEER